MTAHRPNVVHDVNTVREISRYMYDDNNPHAFGGKSYIGG